MKKDKEISIGLNCYTIRFRNKGFTKEYLKIEEVFGSKNFQSIMKDFIKTIDTSSFLNNSGNRVLYLERVLTFKNDILTGIIRKGHSGQQAYIDEVKNKKAKTISTIKKDQFNTIPYFFLISQPNPDSKCFIFLAQSYKQFGFKEVFEEAFKEYTKSHCIETITCEITTLSVPALFNKLLDQGNIKKLRFRKYVLPTNLENLLDESTDDTDPTNYEVEMSVKARKKGFLGIKHKIQTIKDDSRFMEILPIEGFEYDEAIADVSISGRKRSLNMTTPSDFGASYDITEKSDVNIDTNHPNFEKVEQEAISILNEDIKDNIK